MRSIRAARQMLKYLRRVSNRPGRTGTGMASARLTGHLRPAVLLENVGNYLVERRVLHAHVNDGVAVEHEAEDLRDARAIHLQVDARPGLAGDGAQARPVLVGHVVGELEFDDLVTA